MPLPENPLGNPLTMPAELQGQVAQGATARALEAADQLTATIVTRVLTWITQALGSAETNTVAVTSKILQPLTTTLNTAEAVQSGIQSAITGSISGQLSAAGATASPGGPSASGVQPGQFKYEYWSYLDSKGWSQPFLKIEPWERGNFPWCFRGGWSNLYDALNAVGSLPQLPLDACPRPGGPAVPPTGPVQPPPSGNGGSKCPPYTLWFNSGNTPCFVVQCGTSPPPPSPLPWGQYNGNYGTQEAAVADAKASGLDCAIQPPPSALSWFGGCDASGLPVTWNSNEQAPVGTTDIIGPYPDQKSAQANLKCAGSPIQPPTQPPASQCCDVTQKKGDCLMIDLCDWKKFEDAIYNALCRFVKDPECQCDFTDSVKWQINDCDGTYDQALKGWFGGIGSTLLDSSSADDIAAGAQDRLLSSDRNVTFPGPFGPGQ